MLHPTADESSPNSGEDRARPEHRIEPRFVPPPCGACGNPGTQVATRTPYVLYIRCPVCFDAWSVPLPGHTSA
jgi:hypothetical protein